MQTVIKTAAVHGAAQQNTSTLTSHFTSPSRLIYPKMRKYSANGFSLVQMQNSVPSLPSFFFFFFGACSKIYKS